MSATAARQFPAFPIVAEIASEKIEIITKAIEETYEEKKQPIDVFYANLKKVEEFEKHLVEHGLKDKAVENDGEFRRIIPFGSSATDMGTKGSDLDMCIVIERIWRDYTGTAVIRVLEWVKEVLMENRFFNGRIELIDATVPIIRITEGELDVDISVFYGDRPPLNMKSVQMINAYSQIDERFAPLFIFVRQWLKKFSKGDHTSRAHKAIPNSYSTALLIINFMHYYGMVPVLWRTHNALLDPKKATWDGLLNWKIKEYPIKRGDWIFNEKRKQTSRSLGQMFVALLSHYANTVCLENSIIRTAIGESQPKVKMGHRGLLIWDPYDPRNPGRRMSSANAFTSLLQRALGALKSCENVNGLVEALWEVELNYEEIGRHNRKGAISSSSSSVTDTSSGESSQSEEDKDEVKDRSSEEVKKSSNVDEVDVSEWWSDDLVEVDMSEWWSEPEFWKSPEQIQDEKDLAEGWVKAKPSRRRNNNW